MFKKLCTLALSAFLFAAPIIPAVSQAADTVKVKTERTYKKAKHKVRHVARKTKNTVKDEYNKAKTRVNTDDGKRDQQERK